MGKKELLETQRELLSIKKITIDKAQADFQNTLNQIAMELGAKPEELSKWKLDPAGRFFAVPNNQPKKTFPSGKRSKKK